ncbi:MAG: DNA methylase, partial [Thermodesulfobacteriota bacterium]|nr:DNA methylase [Thermodesulfobacteriota bacterium]
MEFENDEARRTYFTDILREKLKDPEFKKIEGFPIGEDEDILALSDPPYYTACPNPWLKDSIKQAKQVPVLINYSVPGKKKRIEKIPNEFDKTLIGKIENSIIPHWHPNNRMMDGKE